MAWQTQGGAERKRDAPRPACTQRIAFGLKMLCHRAQVLELAKHRLSRSQPLLLLIHHRLDRGRFLLLLPRGSLGRFCPLPFLPRRSLSRFCALPLLHRSICRVADALGGVAHLLLEHLDLGLQLDSMLVSALQIAADLAKRSLGRIRPLVLLSSPRLGSLGARALRSRFGFSLLPVCQLAREPQCGIVLDAQGDLTSARSIRHDALRIDIAALPQPMPRGEVFPVLVQRIQLGLRPVACSKPTVHAILQPAELGLFSLRIVSLGYLAVGEI